jgi:hypothetical protein
VAGTTPAICSRVGRADAGRGARLGGAGCDGRLPIEHFGTGEWDFEGGLVGAGLSRRLGFGVWTSSLSFGLTDTAADMGAAVFWGVPLQKL